MHTNHDVVIAGGGLSGCAAALAAAREGCRVLIIERYGFLGGMATAGLVNPFMPYTLWKGKWTYDWDRPVNEGLFKEILIRLDELQGLHTNRQTFCEEVLKLVLDRMMREAGVDVLFHSYLSGADRRGDTLHTLRVVNKSGVHEYTGSVYVDATGDADLSALADCSCWIGRASDNLCQPMTLCFRLSHVDKTKYDPKEVTRKYQEFKGMGRMRNPREDVLMFDHMEENIVHFNSTRVVKKSAVNAEDLSWAEAEAREQVWELYQFLKENIPGFEKARLLMSAPQIGVRESRRIQGLYMVTAEDFLAGRRFEDAIARGTYPVDIHNPEGTGTVLKEIPYNTYYTIPYRALIPKGINNLIVAGRPISSTHEAHSACRVMPICCCIGEAAGIAASIAVTDHVPFAEVDIGKIHFLLNQYGALY